MTITIEHLKQWLKEGITHFNAIEAQGISCGLNMALDYINEKENNNDNMVDSGRNSNNE